VPMTAEVDANELRDAVERLHGCPAQLVEAVSVSESFEGGRSGRGIVHIFDLRRHRSADRCYAWSSRGQPAPLFCSAPQAAGCLAS
jgi:hypothetical protein